MSGGKVERDIWGAVGVLGDLLGKDNPAIKEATDRMRQKVGVPSPDAPPAPASSPARSSGASSDCIDLTQCKACGSFYVTDCACGGKRPEPAPPKMDYAVYDKRGSFQSIQTDAEEACRAALSFEGFVRPRLKKG